MNRIAFDELVEELENSYRDREETLTKASIRWAMLGYFVLAVALAFNLGILASAVAWIIFAPNVLSIKFGGAVAIATGVISFTIVRSLWNRLPAPEGVSLTANDAPRLFELIDEISEASGGVKFHRILLTPELNASVVQVPLAGIFGCYRNYLSLGLPLMDSLEPDEFKAVLSHEFNHLSKKDGRTGNWIYRIRTTWENVAVGIFHREGMLIAPLRKFFEWFWPRFNARAFVLSRFNEYRADAFSASITSPAVASRALQRVHLSARHLDDGFWNDIGRRVSEQPDPPESVFHEMKDFLAGQPDPETHRRWLAQAFATATGTSDTHPSLSDRTKALGVNHDRQLLPPLASSATERFLGPLGQKLRSDFDARWRQSTAVNWSASHQENLSSRQKLSEMELSTAGRALTTDEEWEVLGLRLQTTGVESNENALRSFVHRHPKHEHATFILGSHLLDQDREEGLALMEKLAANPTNTIHCLGMMAGYFDRQGNQDAVRSIKERADLHDSQMNPAIQARNHLSKNDVFIPHGLEGKAVGSIVATLKREKVVREAWLVRKEHAVFSNWNHYVLALDLKFPSFTITTESTTAALLQRIADDIRVDGYLLVIGDQGDMKPACKSIRSQQPDARIYVKA